MRQPMLASAALLVMASSASAASFAPPYVAPTTASVGAQLRWVPVCGRGRPVGSANWDSTDLYLFDMTECFVPSTVGVKALKLVYAGSDITTAGEMDRSVTMTGDAAVWLPGNSFTVVATAAVPVPGSGTTTTIPIQTAQASLGNAPSVGETVSGTGVPSGAMITAVTPTVSSNTITGVSITINALITAALTSGQSLNVLGRNYPATFGQQRQVSIFPKRGFFDSDPIGVSLPAGSAYWVRGSWAASAAGFWLGDYPAAQGGTSAKLTSEADQRSTTAIGDQTMLQSYASNTGGGYWSPFAVLGQVTVPTASVLIVGDSIAAGTGDQADSYGRMGFIERSLGQSVPWASVARGSTSARQMSVNLLSVQDAAAKISATDVLLQYGRNDINASGNPQTAAATEGYLSTIATPLLAAGYRVWLFTVPPTTASSDAWTSAAGQLLVQQSSATTAATSAGAAGAAVTLTVASTAGIAVGEMVAPSASQSTVIPDGTTVTAIPSSTAVTITPLASGTIAAIASGTTIAFGTQTVTQTGTSIEYQREQFNSWCRTSAIAAGYAGCIDDDLYLEDPAHPGLWRTDLGAASLEGVHPLYALHQAVVNAGVIAPAMFPAR